MTLCVVKDAAMISEFLVTPSIDEVGQGSTIDVLYMYISVHPYLEVCTKRDVVGKVVISSDSASLICQVCTVNSGY